MPGSRRHSRVQLLLLALLMLVALVSARSGLIEPASANSNATLWIGCPIAVSTSSPSSDVPLPSSMRVGTAMGLAVINSDPSVLPNHTLACHYETFNATERAALFATLMMLDFEGHDEDDAARFGAGAVAMLTPPHVDLTEVMSLVTNEAQVNMVSPSLTSPVFDDEALYPCFSRVVPSDASEAHAAVLLVERYGWKNVIVVSSTNAALRTPFLDLLSERLPDVNVELVVSLSASDPDVVKSRLQLMVDSSVRIVINLCEADVVDVLFAAAQELDILRGRTWIHGNSLLVRHEKWSDVAFVEHLDGHLAITAQAIPTSLEELTALVGRVLPFADPPIPVAAEYLLLMTNILSTETAVRLIGHALDRLVRDKIMCSDVGAQTLSECQRLVSFDDDDDAALLFYLRNTSISTLFGQLQMDSSGNAVSRVVLFEIRLDAIADNGLGGARVVAGVVDLSSESVTAYANTTSWVAGLSAPPSDVTQRVYTRKQVSAELRGSMVALAAIGMVFAVCCLYFLYAFRASPIVYLSSVRLNCITIVGAVLALAMVIVAAVGEATDKNCQRRHALLLTGFALMYAPLFAKTWRVHKIFNAKMLRILRIQDHKLVPIIAFFVGIALTIGLAFGLGDSMRSERAEVSVSEGGDAIEVDYVTYCATGHPELLHFAVYTFKSMVLLFGSLLAWQVRNVGMLAVNESKWIGLAIYTAVLLELVALPSTLTTYSAPSSADTSTPFLISSMATILGAVSALVFVFVPKFVAQHAGEASRWALNLSKSAEDDQILDVPGTQGRTIASVSSRRRPPAAWKANSISRSPIGETSGKRGRTSPSDKRNARTGRDSQSIDSKGSNAARTTAASVAGSSAKSRRSLPTIPSEEYQGPLSKEQVQPGRIGSYRHQSVPNVPYRSPSSNSRRHLAVAVKPLPDRPKPVPLPTVQS